MARLVYYVAQSLDGFIAGPDDGVAFLDGFASDDDHDDGYAAFYAGIDSLVTGRRTYEVVLGFGGEWPYAEKPLWVMTSAAASSDRSDVFFTDRGPKEVLEEIQAAGHEHTWLLGGGQLAAAFENEGLIDEWIVSIVPYVLGNGIPVVGEAVKPKRLALLRHHVYSSGLVTLAYGRG